MGVTLSDRLFVGRRAWRLPSLVVLVGALLTAIYFLSYLSNPAVPGNHGRYPLGWWGWWDQSQYLLSAQSFAHADFGASHHWYPFGYALLGAPFVLISSSHPYLVPDLVCLLLTYAAFLVFAGTVGVGRRWAAMLFLLATCGNEILRAVWAEPWNTSLSCVLIWWLLALTARHLVRLPGTRRSRLAGLFCIGLLVAAIPATRPTDALLVAIWGIGAGVAAIRLNAIRRTDLQAIACGVIIAGVPEALIWLRIYGTHASQYMINSRVLGFDFSSLGWKTYLLLVTPRPWFPFGAGIVQRLPWALPGLAGMLALPWIVRGTSRMLLVVLACMITAYSLLFFAYVDLIPSGLWRYNNIHYFKWALPGLALLAFLLLRALAMGPRLPALLACMLTLLLVDLRLSPKLVGDAVPAWLIQQPGPVPGWSEAYFTTMTLRDDRGVLMPIRDFRAIADDQGWRLIALNRPFIGPVIISGLGHWPDGPASSTISGGTALRWGRTFGLRLPCSIVRCVHVPL